MREIFPSAELLRRIAWVFGALLAVTQSSKIAAQSKDRTFISLLGRDTVSVERISKNGDVVVSDVVLRAPTVTRYRYEAELEPTGRVRQLTATKTILGLGAIGGWTRASLTFVGDSVISTTTVSNNTSTARLRAPDAFPAGVSSLFDQELVFAWLQRQHRASADVPLVVVGQTNAWPDHFELGPGDSAHVGESPNTLHVLLDERGSLRAVDGRRTTVKIVAREVTDLDLERVTRSFVASERDGSGMAGGVSPAGKVEGTIGDARVTISYGRPSTRGRDVWSNGVLGDTLWRTGANAATVFETSRDLAVGGLRLPAGRYSLWTLVSRSAYELRFNAQSGQWGTEYHPERDVLRVPMTVESLASPVEQLTISFKNTNPSRLVIEWGVRRLVVPIAR